MSKQVSRNVRYLLWKKGIPRTEWVSWLVTRSSVNPQRVRDLVHDRLSDSTLTSEDVSEIARVLEIDGEGEVLRFGDFAKESGNLLRENLSYLFDSLGRGGKKNLAAELGIDPTTISRWLNGTFPPSTPSLHQLEAYFGLPSDTQLHDEPIFLSVEPVSLKERRNWLRVRIDALSLEELRELYPALRRLLEERL